MKYTTLLFTLTPLALAANGRLPSAPAGQNPPGIVLEGAAAMGFIRVLLNANAGRSIMSNEASAKEQELKGKAQSTDLKKFLIAPFQFMEIPRADVPTELYDKLTIETIKASIQSDYNHSVTALVGHYKTTGACLAGIDCKNPDCPLAYDIQLLWARYPMLLAQRAWNKSKPGKPVVPNN